MDRGDELIQTLKALMAERRRELGDPPTPEELVAYRDRRLSAQHRAEIEAKLGAFPEAARALADLAAFPDVEPAPGVPELTDEDVKDRWRSFRGRLEARETPAPISRIDQARTHSAPSPRPPAWLPAAAVVALAMVGAAFFLGRLTAPGVEPATDTAVNVPVVQLSPRDQDRTRSEPTSVEMSPAAEGLVLVLDLGAGADPEARYRIEIAGPGDLSWQRQGLSLSSYGTLHMSLTRPDLPAGTYRIEVSRAEEPQQPVVAYELRLTRPEGADADGP